MGKMKREWEAMQEFRNLDANSGSTPKKGINTNDINDPFNLWDNDDKGDAMQDVEHLNHLMNSLDTD